MKKVTIQFLTIVLFFFGTWFLLSQINWTSLLHTDRISQSSEKKLGDLVWKVLSNSETDIHTESIIDPLNNLISTLCQRNSIRFSNIKLHIIKKDEVNAFALPDDHLVVYTGLIASCESEAELLGVLGHEIAHMEKNHVVKKLVKEIGLSAIISVATNNRGGELAKKVAKMLSSNAYDRELEREADKVSVNYLLKAGIDPHPFANFLYRLGVDNNIPEQAYWLSTHPDSKERAEYILQSIKGKRTGKTKILNAAKWDLMKKEIENMSDIE